MHLTTVITLALATAANAHFQLQYPIPRGPFVASSEPSFCDGYTNAVPNRTVYPLTNGVINLHSGHQQWTIGVIVSAKQDPTSFADFNSSSGYQMAVPFFQVNGAGQYCFPIDLAASGISGVQDGANVTIQIVYDGGDTNLYQCADLTLSANVTTPSNATSSCTNVTSASGTTSAPSSTSTSGARKNGAVLGAVVTGLLGLVISFL